MGVLGGVFVLKSGLRILIWAPQVPFLVPPKTPKMGHFGCFWLFMTTVDKIIIYTLREHDPGSAHNGRTSSRMYSPLPYSVPQTLGSSSSYDFQSLSDAKILKFATNFQKSKSFVSIKYFVNITPTLSSP